MCSDPGNLLQLQAGVVVEKTTLADDIREAGYLEVEPARSDKANTTRFFTERPPIFVALADRRYAADEPALKAVACCDIAVIQPNTAGMKGGKCPCSPYSVRVRAAQSELCRPRTGFFVLGLRAANSPVSAVGPELGFTACVHDRDWRDECARIAVGCAARDRGRVVGVGVIVA